MNSESRPIVFLLCGLPGSGKTTYAKELEKIGVIRLSLDEELFKLFGRQFSPDQYTELEAKTKRYLLEQLDVCLNDHKSVVLDWGFWRKDEREEIKTFVSNKGGKAKLVYFKRSLDVFAKGIENRNLYDNHKITIEMLKKFVTQFEEPRGENEEIM